MEDRDKKELLEIFEKLDPVNKADVLAHFRSTFVTQENTKKAIEESQGKKIA
jgi:hypothetical protein